MSLKEYSRKRNFERTGEPKPSVSRLKTRRFVVQKHAASRLHYDFRLEIGGALKSWAVPKGVPWAKGEKRLAMQVEDHPVSYIEFEGTIPKEQYGGGTVMVWDRGTFEILGKDELAEGKLHVLLHGEKLEGEWYLVQMRGGKEWLLIRGGADLKPVSKKQDDTSALSGKSMGQLSKGGPVWTSKEGPSAERRQPTKSSWKPRFIEPMKAKLVSQLPDGGDWTYEVKFDGFRALAFKHGAEVRLLSRNEKDLSGKFPEVVDAVSGLVVPDCILDGEIVALDEMGRSSFQRLQAAELGEERPPLFFYVFDLLGLKGVDLRRLPLEERKKLLEALLKDGPPLLRYSASLPGTAKALLTRVRKLGLEGLIGKRNGSPYEAGIRSGAWIKVKFRLEQEFVIGGYTDPEGSRKHFGALLVGYYDHGKLVFSGRVGTGFSATVLRSLSGKMGKLARTKCPFDNLPEKRTSRYGQAVTASVMKQCHWIKPVLVCQVRFAEWTRDVKLRQPVFLGLREDKDAAEVVRERAR